MPNIVTNALPASRSETPSLDGFPSPSSDTLATITLPKNHRHHPDEGVSGGGASPKMPENVRRNVKALKDESTKVRGAALEIAVSAETILQGFRKLDDDVIELTLPVGTTILEAGKLLNAAAKEKGMKYPVFVEGDAGFWKENEANAAFKTEPGRTYQFKIPMDSIGKTKYEQVRDHGGGAPLGAVAIAEACERLTTENNGTLLKGCFVRGANNRVALDSGTNYGVYVIGYNADHFHGAAYPAVAFASSVSARNKES